MRLQKIGICLFTAVLIALAFLAGMQQQAPEAEEPLNLSFSLESQGNTEHITYWKNESNEYYIFLPGYGQLPDLTAHPGDGSSICLGDTVLTEGMGCEAFETDKAYSLTVNGELLPGTLTFLRSGGMPTLYIDTQSGSMEYIHLDTANQETGNYRLYSPDGALENSGGLTVEGRGNSSWAADKKPYSLTLSQEADLLDMGSAQRWILLAEGYVSCINLRNKIVYDYAAQAHLPYTPDTRWVELYLNGEYTGLYLLSERNEIHPRRVSIPAESSFLVSLEWDYVLAQKKVPNILTQAGQNLRIYSSSLDDEELTSLWQSAENAILSEEGIDPVTGKHWQELIDMDSWVRKYLLEEIFGNSDGGSFSQFFYCDTAGDGKIYAGPVWDYDLAMGGYGIWLKPYTDYYTMNRSHKEEGVYNPWFQALYQKQAFYERLTELYEAEFLPLMEALLESRLEEYITRTARANRLDALRWGFPMERLEQEQAYIRSFLEKRRDFLTDVWVNGSKYHVVRVDPGRKDVYGYFAVKPGQTLPELPSYEDIRGLGWFDVQTGEPFDVTQPIYADAEIYVKKPENTIPKIHFLPMLAVLAALPALALGNWIRIKKDRRQRSDRTKSEEIPA